MDMEVVFKPPPTLASEACEELVKILVSTPKDLMQ